MAYIPNLSNPNIRYLVYIGENKLLTKDQIYEVRYFDEKFYAVFMDDGSEIVEPIENFKRQFESVLNETSEVDSHYKESVEPIDIIEAFDLNFNRGNVIKYTARAGRKDDELQDLKKALWYLKREIKNIEDGRK